MGHRLGVVRMPIFGDIDGVPVGATFPDRRALLGAGVHRQLQAGIVGSAAEGADSIVVSGGYEDDDDFGDLIIYTGQGGNDPATKRQVADQRLTLGNAAPAESCCKGLPVRVIRGRNPGSIYAPPSGFRYDGLYYIDEYWQAQGKSGFSIWRFRLISQEQRPSPDAVEPGPASRVATTVQRLVRSTEVVQRAKELHSYACQVCGSAPPIGPVSTDFRDLDVLQVSTAALRRIGFGSRWAIHPAQVPVINQAFTPTPEQLEAAQRLGPV
jgi:putative restriction endonuclease